MTNNQCICWLCDNQSRKNGFQFWAHVIELSPFHRRRLRNSARLTSKMGTVSLLKSLPQSEAKHSYGPSTDFKNVRSCNSSPSYFSLVQYCIKNRNNLHLLHMLSDKGVYLHAVKYLYSPTSGQSLFSFSSLHLLPLSDNYILIKPIIYRKLQIPCREFSIALQLLTKCFSDLNQFLFIESVRFVFVSNELEIWPEMFSSKFCSHKYYS